MYALIIWTVVGFTSVNSGSYKEISDWRQLAEFKSPSGSTASAANERCRHAAWELDLKPGQFRCIQTQ